MGRSVKKGPYVDERLLAKVNASIGQEPIKTWARACTIVPEFISRTFMVHTGNKFVRVFVTEDMVGHKLGEFAPTRTFRGHGGKKAAAAAAPAPGPTHA
jgi:small subunit ribosomal protein S19